MNSKAKNASSGKIIGNITEADKKLISILRQTGLSYKQISEKAGIAEGTVKMFCLRNNVEKGLNTEKVSSDHCLQCGDILVFIPNHKKKKFCCDNCRLKYWRSHSSERVSVCR